MKVTVSVGGTWNAFRLAEQLDHRGMLQRLVTTHRPLRNERINPRRIVINPIPEILMRGPRLLGLRWEIGDYLKAVTFDRWAARYTVDCDLLAVWALFALRSMRAARANGVCTVLQQGSTHALTQRELLREEYRRWGQPAPRDRLLDQKLREYDEADFVEVTSRWVLRSFLDRGFPRERLLHVPNLGIDLRLFHPQPHAGRPFRIVAVGLSLRKGTPYLLEAVARLRIPDLELWLVGSVSPDLRPILRRTPTRVRHLGVLSHPELAAVYRAASVFVLPSIEEGLAQVILEAMASGLPVVLTPNTGGEDIMTERREGLFVPPRDPAALARALLELYEDETLRRAMSEAAARSAQAWTWEAYGDRAVSTYARLAGHPPAATQA